MNVNKPIKFSQYNLMSELLPKTRGNKTTGFGSLDKMSDQYRKRYADSNEVKVNSQGLTGMLFILR